MIWQSVHGLLDFVDESLAPGLIQSQTLAKELDEANPISHRLDDAVPVARIVSHDNWLAFLDAEVEALQENRAEALPGEYAAESRGPCMDKGPEKTNPWYPFKSQMVGLLMIRDVLTTINTSMG
jgi:hypothetical protein